MTRTDEQAFRLSPQQRRSWLFGLNGRIGMARCDVAITGPMDLDLLRSALAQLVEHREILRTHFRTVPGMAVPVQIIGPPRFCWQVEQGDGTPCACHADDVALHAHVHTESSSRHVIRIGLPALCADRTSLQALVQELGRHYERLRRSGSRPPAALQYADLAEWQHDLLEDEATVAPRTYWQELGIERCPATFLPVEPRSGWSVDAVDTPATVTRSVDVVAAELGRSPESALLAGWVVLLERLYGCGREVVVGVEVAGREHEELRDVLGPLARRVPVVCRLEEDMTFGHVVAQVEPRIEEARRWAPYFTWDAVLPGADGRTPFLRYGFAYHRDLRSLSFGSLTFEFLRVEAPTDRFEVALDCSHDGARQALRFHYDATRVPQHEVVMMSERLAVLLLDATRRPSCPIGDLDVLVGEDWELQASINGTHIGYPTGGTVHGLFEAEARANPERVAVVSGDRRMTYAELDARADGVAARLHAIGLGPGARVGICTSRGPGMAVAVLGVLKAGAAYVPMEPSWPRERLATVAADAGVAVVVVTAGTAVAAAASALELLLVEDADAFTPPTGARLGPVHPASLAYVMYTSGSTGSPKGVEVEHRQLVNYVRAIADRLDLATCSSLLLLSPLAADFSNTVLFGALCGGRELHLVDEATSLSAAGLGRYLRRNEIDCIKITPSHLRALHHEMPAEERPMPRRLLILGGEPTPSDWARSLRAAHPACTVVTHYGPTEATVGVLTCDVAQLPGVPEERLPLGRPLANTRVYVLDRLLRPVPPGVTGELCIGGAGVARDYLGQPGLTADRFRPDPFGSEAGGRLYRTGDLARMQPDGALQFLGRADDQVKIRGFRVEPGEIEALLRRHPAVVDAAVVAREEGPAGLRLTGYVVLASPSHVPQAEELRSYLGARVPDYMVPSAIIPLAALPLTPTGKVDRTALPASARAAPARARPAPDRLVEQMLAGMWEEVLQVAEAAAEDDFFDAGGDSLAAIQLVTRIRQAFGVDFSVRSLFEARTLRRISRTIEAQRRPAGLDEVVPLAPATPQVRRQLSFAQQRLWVVDRLYPGDPTYNVYRVLSVQGLVDIDVLQRCLDEIVRRHEVLRTTFPPSDGVPALRVHRSLKVPITVVDVTEGGDGIVQVERLAHEEIARPFDLEHGPLLRVRLLRLRPDDAILVVSMHHIISDDWSMGVFAREAMTLYRAFSAGVASPLSELPVQYADFAAWQAQRATNVLDRQLAYWRRQLAGPLPVLDLPSDGTRCGTGARVYRQLPAALSDALNELNRRNGATLFMTGLAAFAVLLGRYSHDTDLIVGTPIVNRDVPETEALIGLFVNVLALRLDLSGNPSFLELLERVRRVSLDAYSNRDVPLEKLVAELQPQRVAGRTPLLQVSFVVENVPRPDLEVAGLTMTPLDLDNATTKLDLGLSLQRTDDELQASIEYDTGLFAETTILGVLEQFETLLVGITANPSQRVVDLPLLSGSAGPNTTTSANSTHGTVHDLIAGQAAATPDAVAVSCGGEHLTYAALDERANRLAHRLIGLGAGPEVRVGIYLERSTEMLVAMLGLLKAGAAFVQVEPSTSPDRVAFMLADSGASMVLTRPDLADRLPPDVRSVVCLETHNGDLNRYPPDPPPSRGTARNLACVIYSWGATDRPEGTMVEHGGLTTMITAQRLRFTLDLGDRVLQWSSPGSETSLFEVLLALGAGARVYLATVSGAEVEELVKEEGISALVVPASMLAGVRLGDALPLRTLIVAGEVSPSDLAPVWADGRDVYSAYGGPESSMCASTFRLDRIDTVAPIGKPVAHARIYVLNSSGEPVPVGGCGEIYVAGAGVARGYVGRPALTAERFVPDPFGSIPGHRLFRTGDIGRLLPTGEIELVRRDLEPTPEGGTPAFSTERTVAAIMANVLNVPQLARDDHFFMLGGHSLLAFRMLTQLRDAFGIEVPVRLIFDCPTVSGLAAAIDELRGKQEGDADPVTPAPNDGPLPLTLLQEQMWRIEQALPGRSYFNVHVAFRIRGPFVATWFKRCVGQVVQRHGALRTTFGEAEGRPHQRIHPDVLVPVEEVDLRDLPEPERLATVRWFDRQQARRSFDLARGPLFRVSVVRLAEDDHVVMFTVHHAVSDASSIAILMQELNDLYAAQARNEPLALPVSVVHFGDFACWQRQRIDHGDYDDALAYWRLQLAHCSEPLRFAPARKNDSQLSFRTATRSRFLPPALVRDLEAVSRLEGVTLFTTLLAGFTAALHGWTGGRDIRVGTNVTSRNRGGLEGVVGCFVNTLVLRSALSPTMTLGDVLYAVRDTARAAYSHQDVPFEYVLAHLDLEAGQRRTLFQAMLILEDSVPPVLSAAGLNVAPFGSETTDGAPAGSDVTATTLDLVLRVTPESDGLRATFIYKVDTFDGDVVDEMLTELCEVLRRLVFDPHCGVSQLPAGSRSS